MVKCQTIKLEFTPGSENSFETSTKIYGCHIECAGKAAGKIGDNYFSAKYRFNIDAHTPTPKICSIYFTDVTHIGKTDTPQFGCSHYYYYYDINSSDSSSSYSNIIDDTFENLVYGELYSIFSNAIVILSGITLTITLQNTSTINYLVLHIKVGAHSYGSSSSVYNENSISDAIGKSCSKSSKSNKSSSSSSHKKSTSSSSTGSITTSSKTSTSSFFTSKTSKSSKSKKSYKKHKKSAMQNILKLIAWSAIISFIMYIFKTKINGGRR